MRPRETWRTRATGVALAAVLASAGPGPSLADPLAIEKDGAVKVEKQLEVGPNGSGVNDKGALIQGFNGRNYFQDQEKAGALRVGGSWGIPGIYSEKGDVVVGSQSNKIQLKGDVAAKSYVGMGAIPVGAVLMWYGKPSSVPEGWVLCDGANDTPDLSGRFIAGLALGEADYATIGKTGGEAKHTLLTSEIPDHVHKLGEKIEFAGQHRHNLFGANPPADNVGTLYAGRWENQQNTGPIIATKEAASHENRPPYAVLAYIMYKGWNLPPGPYRDSCRKIAKVGSTLKGECQKVDGTWQQTQLDAAPCQDGTISNANGALGCTKR